MKLPIPNGIPAIIVNKITLDIFILLPTKLNAIANPSGTLCIPITIASVIPNVSVDIKDEPIANPSGKLCNNMLINIRYPAFISLDISNFVFKNIVNNTPTNVNITVGKTPISFIDSFIKSNTTTASIIPPDRPIKKSKYRSTFLLNKADIIPPRPVPITPASNPIIVILSIIFSLLVLYITLYTSHGDNITKVII